MLAVSNLQVQRGKKTCVDSVTAQFSSGKLTALVGPNGAGKSSLIKSISGEWPRSSGEVTLLGRPQHLWLPKQRARFVAVMPQHPRIGFDFRVEELVKLGRSPHSANSSAQKDQAIIEFCLGFVGLKGYSERSVLTLSGGELQRVYLAKAIAQVSTIKNQLPGKDTLLLLDEPTSALDMAQQITAMNAMREIARNGGTVVAVMHDLNLVSCFADYVVLMKHGAILNQGSPEEVLQPCHLEACFDCVVAVDRRQSDDKLIVSVG
jgi:iron complex transport system ATP-binding protein